MKRLGITFLALCIYGIAEAQSVTEWRDTLPPALRVDHRMLRVETGHTSSDIATMRRVVSPLGEGDAIKLIQSLPGVSTGAEGGSAIFVRGGNLGSNLLTLDGVTVHGISHLLGLASSVSSDAIGEMDFQVGGFDADRSHLTASHIHLSSADPGTERIQGKVFLSNFLAGVSMDGPLTSKTGILVAARISPLSLEYRAAGKFLPDILSMKDFGADVYDLYGKVSHRFSDTRTLTLSGFHSQDCYRMTLKDDGLRSMGWHNTIGLLRYSDLSNPSWHLHADLSFNDFSNRQQWAARFHGVGDTLQMRSSLREAVLDAKVTHPLQERTTLQFGIMARWTMFNPGEVMTTGPRNVWKNNPVTGTIWGQMDKEVAGLYHLKASARSSVFFSGDKRWFAPEIDLLAEYYLSDDWLINITADRLVQFKHTLEGIPLGWSMDMIVPTDASIPPETAWQGYAGVRGRFGAHRLSLGGYTKYMDGLVHFTQATAVFGISQAGWKNQVDIGRGTSYGGEFLYEFSGRRFYGKAAYTLSKTDRRFPKLNDGLPFPAQFDRRHILHADAEYTLSKKERTARVLTLTFTLQSGHWESVKDFSYPGILPGKDPVDLPYFGKQPNNYQMPTYIRMDIGYHLNWRSARLTHDLNLGVYNLLNRHNPFMLIYDTNRETWMELSIFPILPNFSYRLTFGN